MKAVIFVLAVLTLCVLSPLQAAVEPKHEYEKPGYNAGHAYDGILPEESTVTADVITLILPVAAGGGAAVLGTKAALTKADDVVDAVKTTDKLNDARKLDKAPTGPGSVPPSQRDPKRVWTKAEKQQGLDAAGGKCEGCGDTLTIDQTKGHHKTRHADGGKTVP